MLDSEHTLMRTCAAFVRQTTGHQHLVRTMGCDLHDEPHTEVPVPVDVVGRDRPQVHLVQLHHIIDGRDASAAPHDACITVLALRSTTDTATRASWSATGAIIGVHD